MQTHQPARVCVSTLRERRGASRHKSESHDGAASPPRGRAQSARRNRLRTTTNYILGLDSSSIGRENNDKISLLTGWSA